MAMFYRHNKLFLHFQTELWARMLLQMQQLHKEKAYKNYYLRTLMETKYLQKYIATLLVLLQCLLQQLLNRKKSFFPYLSKNLVL